MEPSASGRRRAWLAVPLALVSALAISVAIFQTRVTWFRDHDPTGAWHVRVWDSSAVLLPVSFLLFALGIEWATRRRPMLAVPALLPLPVWCVSLLAVESLLGNDCWIAIMVMPLQGLAPFGVR